MILELDILDTRHPQNKLTIKFLECFLSNPGVHVDLFCFFPVGFDPASSGEGAACVLPGTYSSRAFSKANSAATKGAEGQRKATAAKRRQRAKKTR